MVWLHHPNLNYSMNTRKINLKPNVGFYISTLESWKRKRLATLKKKVFSVSFVDDFLRWKLGCIYLLDMWQLVRGKERDKCKDAMTISKVT